MSLANTSYQGQCIFAGSQTSAPPFTASNLTSPATTTCSGDSNVDLFHTPEGQTIQLNMPGNQVFTVGGTNSVFGALNQVAADYAGGTGSGTPRQIHKH